MEWWWFARARLWVGVEKGVVAGGRSVVSVSAVLGGGMAHTMFGWRGAAVVMEAAVELGVVVRGLGVVRSASSEMVSGGGKGRKQGMDE